jgi:hypothetical protein
MTSISGPISVFKIRAGVPDIKFVLKFMSLGGDHCDSSFSKTKRLQCRVDQTLD